ncbi:PqiC family protein [Rivibacter subsaxonicus]|uniref:Putative lipoprotein YmbA n=1 Tax=Rivibacter subsaxonicus TaxID=457575 RepID=A0A4V2FRS0_9BURK|nr:ABC-type transport auxiliary lipoprotein family protein [Rivibacter subsaxonicus]RZT91429.1 putative lipoprotein YmbA [Rivibacter subsaxonicus]
MSSPLRATTALLALLLGACATPDPPPVLLTLPPTVPLVAAPATTPARSAAEAPLLAVRRVAIPEYLLVRRVRYRADASTLADWPHTFWAERIEVAVSREFVSALRPALPQWAVCEGNCPERPPQATLQVEIVPMDYWRPQRVLRARARMTISTPGTTAPARSFETSLELPAVTDSPQAQAEAISELLQRLAAVAAAALKN